MELDFLKKWDENCTAILLSLTVIGLLYLLKVQEDKVLERNQTMISSETTIVTYVE
jgi:hypothetical protein